MLKDEAAIALHMEQFKKNFSQNAFVAPLFQLYEDKNEISLYKIIPTWIRWLDLRESDGNNEFIQSSPKKLHICGMIFLHD